MIEAGILIGGRVGAAHSGQTFTVLDPFTEAPMAEVARAGAEDVARAVELAKEGFRDWSSLAPAAREAVLLRAAELFAVEGEERFLDLLIRESGSVIAKARYEIAYSVDLLRAAAGEVRRLYGDTLPHDNPARWSMVLREPLGVVAVVSPYNAPLALLVKMAGFPLAAGNSVVIKPSEETPLVALAFGQLLLDAGLPPKALSVLPGFGGECGAPLVNHPDVRAIALTGATSTGRMIGAAAIDRMCRVQLELGGKSALLVLRDFDIDTAAKQAVAGMFAHAGQICMANSRIVVERAIREPFLKALKREVEALKLDDPYDMTTAYGPLINRRALEKVQGHLKAALDSGAELLTGGSVVRGLVHQPTVLLEPSRQSAVWRDESFGPITSVVAVDDLDAAINAANDSDYGLSAGVLTNRMDWALKAAREIRSGAVHIGCHPFQTNALAPVGGVGFSGIGRSGGKFSTAEFTELKWVSFAPEILPSRS